jgi:hypothetical protein
VHRVRVRDHHACQHNTTNLFKIAATPPFDAVNDLKDGELVSGHAHNWDMVVRKRPFLLADKVILTKSDKSSMIQNIWTRPFLNILILNRFKFLDSTTSHYMDHVVKTRPFSYVFTKTRPLFIAINYFYCPKQERNVRIIMIRCPNLLSRECPSVRTLLIYNISNQI